MLSPHDPSAAADDSVRTHPSVAKWPFVLGDIVLVAAALGLWAAESPLNEMQTALCFGAIALGAIMFALPYLFEFFAHTRTIAPAQLLQFELERARAEHFQRQAIVEAALHKHARSAAEAQENSARAAAAIEHTARRLDTRLAALETSQKSFAAAASQLQEAAARQADQEKEDLQREIERLRQEEADKLHAAATALAAAGKRLDALAAKLESALAHPPPPAPAPDPEIAATLADVRSALEKFLRREALAPASKKKDSPAEPAPENTAPPAAANGALARLETEGGPPSDDAPASPGAENAPANGGDSMLAKALSSAQPADDSSAVTRIIQSRPRKPRKPKADTAAAPSTETPPGDAPAADAPPAQKSEPASPEASAAQPEAEAWDALATGKLDMVTASAEIATAEPPPPAPDPPSAAPEPAPEIVAPAAATAIAEAGDETGGAAVAVSARAKAAALFADDEEEAPADAPAAVEQAVLIEAEAPAAPPAPRRRSGKAAADAATLVARVLIGIGNKPYLRGDGPGLSPDKGVPMEFVEIGKWQWAAPADASEPMKVRLFKNDEVPAEGGPVTLKPGELLEIEPRFPA